MLKLGLKPITGITRATIKKAKNILFVISKPEVFKSPASDTYIIFGEAKIEDTNAQAQNAAAGQFKNPVADAGAPLSSVVEDDDIPELVSDEVVDETGMDPDEIQTIMLQAGCSRAKAVKALRKNNNSLVDAILELTP
jgi:nascent polypeptide-associated complex subunit alpha